MLRYKKVLAAVLAVITLLSVFPLTALAGEPMPIEDAGKNGNLTWSVKDNVLFISGEDEMTDFCVNGMEESPLYMIETGAPWTNYRDTVTTVVIRSGVTSIGSYAFNAFKKMTKLFLPKTVEEIKEYAFEGCTALKTIYWEWGELEDRRYSIEWGNDAFDEEKVVWGKTYESTISYTVKFKANGGAGTMEDQMIQRDKATALKANKYKKSCYTFAGWNTKADGSGTAYKNKAGVTNLAKAGKSVTLYAQWKLSSGCYTVKYVLNGGKNNCDNPTAYSSKGKDIKLKNPTRSGYTFAGWYKKADFSDTKVTKITAATKKNITLYAKWVKTYSVQFVANGGKGTMSNATCTVNVSRKLPANKFTRDFYTFKGWNTKANGKGKAYANKASVKNLSKKQGATVKLYAQWKLNSGCYSIKYELNGGTNSAKNPEAYSAKGDNIKLKNPTRTGYTFGGWYAKSDFSGSKVTTITASAKKNVKLYAKWTANKYTVKFNANGGTGSMASKTYTYGKRYTLPANGFTKSGDYIFTGWNTKADGSGTLYDDTASVSNLSAKSGGTVTLYAQWQLAVTDGEELTRACNILRRTGEPLHLKKQNQNVSYKYDANGSPLWSIGTRANGTWQYIHAYDPATGWIELGATYCSAWGTPYITMSSSNDLAETFRSELLDGTYDFNNDPGNVYIAWSMYSSDTTKADFQKMINNKISDEVFDAVIAKYNAWATSTYGASCVIVYGKDSDGKLIGKYAGSVYYNQVTNATICHLVGINPKNTADYGITTNETLIY